ncbi:MAG: PadR family transcriptional regulator [Anaerolineaceae bacterium]|jgi:DNA-binding PadR family transcriptional regulator
MKNGQNFEEVVKRATPLTEASFYILLTLAEPLHGYGIMQKVSDLTHDRVQLGPGTLYGALTNLQSLGLIRALEEKGNDRRKQYLMTELGRVIAEHEITRLEEAARHGRMLLRM